MKETKQPEENLKVPPNAANRKFLKTLLELEEKLREFKANHPEALRAIATMQEQIDKLKEHLQLETFSVE